VIRTDDLRTRVRFERRRGAMAARRATARVARKAAPIRRPIFVLGCPRSGTTLLFAVLRCHPDLAGSGAEGHVLWDTYQHPAGHGWTSDRSTAETIRPGEAAFLNGAIARLTHGGRFLDKTPKHSLRVQYLDALFPDASFVFLRRDGRATVSSLIEGWTRGHAISYRLPVTLDLGAYRGRYWSYLLPPGWRRVIRTSIPEVAALQYRAANEIALDDLSRLDPARVSVVSFEDLLADPRAVVGDLLERLELRRAGSVLRFADDLDRHTASSLSPPRPDKWLERGAELAPVMDRIAPTMRRLGYEDV